VTKLMVVLHSHIPYVKDRGEWPYGHEWIYESLLKCYLPLMMMFEDEEMQKLSNVFTHCVSPILSQQLADEKIIDGFSDFLDKKIDNTKHDIKMFESKKWKRLQSVANICLEEIERTKQFWEKMDRDYVTALKCLFDKGYIEIGSAAATHGMLPLLDEDSIRMQIGVGVESTANQFGIKPFSFWIPECGYKPGVEKILEENGVGFTFLGSEATDEFDDIPYRLGNSNVMFMGRQRELSKQVWSSEVGYPGDDRYIAFEKKYKRSGNRYWRNTGSMVTLGNKDVYNAVEAKSAISEHVSDFIRKLESYSSETNAKCLLLSFDAEVFGHWWYEGVGWISEFAKGVEASEKLETTTPKSCGFTPSDVESKTPKESCWGQGGDFRSWKCLSVKWIWDDLAEMSKKFFEVKQTNPDKRLLAQLERELLIAQASDWEFLITTKQARIYGENRFNMHKQAFWDVVDKIEGIDINIDSLFDKDSPFQFLG